MIKSKKPNPTVSLSLCSLFFPRRAELARLSRHRIALVRFIGNGTQEVCLLLANSIESIVLSNVDDGPLTTDFTGSVPAPSSSSAAAAKALHSTAPRRPRYQQVTFSPCGNRVVFSMAKEGKNYVRLDCYGIVFIMLLIITARF